MRSNGLNEIFQNFGNNPTCLVLFTRLGSITFEYMTKQKILCHLCWAGTVASLGCN